MFKEELINTLNSTTVKDMPEFFVMSYNRGGKVVTMSSEKNKQTSTTSTTKHLLKEDLIF